MATNFWTTPETPWVTQPPGGVGGPPLATTPTPTPWVTGDPSSTGLPPTMDTPTPVGSPSSPTAPGGGTNWTDFINSLFGGVNNVLSGTSPMARFLAAQHAANRGADEMNEQAGRYEALGERAASQADPWGNDRRTMFQGRLDDLLNDPTKSPVYQSMMREAMSSLGPQMSSQGRPGGGDWARTIGDVANKFTGEWADRYGRFGGSEVDPSRASAMLMEGGRLSGDARAQALAARLYPLGLLADGNGGNGAPSTNPNGGGGGDPISQILRALGIGNPTSGGSNPSGISPTNAASLLRMLGQGGSSLQNLWSDFSGSPVGLQETYGDIAGGDWDFSNFDPSWWANLPGGYSDPGTIDDISSFFDWGG